MFCILDKTEQLNFLENTTKINSMITNNSSKFLELLKNNFDITVFIPQNFYANYYSSTTNDRTYKLESILSALLIAHFFHFTSMLNLVVLLTFSPEIREFCKFDNNKIPDESLFSKFKINFDNQLLQLFDKIAEYVIELLLDFDKSLPEDSPIKDLCNILIYDTTGLKPKVKENNPKFVASEIKRQKAFAKANNSQKINPYAAAYNNLPKYSNANPSIKLDYANGHFAYFYKFGLISNGFGIPLHIHFLDDDFYNSLPSSFTSMEEQKYIFDNASLAPVLSSFWRKSSFRAFHTFLGDSEFDSYSNYNLLKSYGFDNVLIPINPRNSKPDNSVTFPLDQEFIPICPKLDKPFISDGIVRGKNRSPRFKFVCPLSQRVKGKWTCNCSEPCRPTNSTVTTYVYPNGDLRNFFGIQRGSKLWHDTYKKRSVIERSFSSLKSNPSLAMPRTYNLASLRSDVLLTAITKLITVILAFSIEKPDLLANFTRLLSAC